jgi:hypothetical protein
MARAFSVMVNIGATVMSSVDSSARAVERRMGAMGRAWKLQMAEQKAMAKRAEGFDKTMATMFAGAAAGSAFKKFITAGSEYQHQIQIMKASGRTVSEIAQGIAAAHKTMAALPTATLTDNLRVLNETTLAYGNYHHAIENLTFNQRMGGMLQNILGEKAGDTGEMFNNLIRAMEMRMGADAGSQRARGELSNLYQAMIVSNGKINPAEILNFAQTSNPAMRGYDERFFTRIVPSLIQEFGGERAGTGLTAFNNQIMGRVAVGGKKLTEEWIRLGLVPKRGSGGNLSATGWTPGSMKGTALAMSDPLAFAEQVLLPAMKSHGVNINDEKAVGLEIKKLFGRETAARLAGTLASPQQRARLHKDEAMYARALGPEAAYTNMLRNDPNMALAASAASLKNLETAIGNALSPAVIKTMNMFAKGVNFLATTIENHPRLGVTIGGIFAALTGLAAVRLGQWALGFLRLGGALKFLAGAPFAALNGFLGLFLRMSSLGGLMARPWVMGLARGLMALGPAIIEGIGAAFALLSNPVGWTILAVAGVAAAGALIWHFRKQLGQAWGMVTQWFGQAFSNLMGWIKGLPWAKVGMAIADGLTFGLASKLPNMVAAIHRSFPWLGGAAAPSAPGSGMGGGKQRGAYAAEQDAMAALRRGDWASVGRDAAVLRENGRLGASQALLDALRETHPGYRPANANNPVPANVNIAIYETKDARATADAVSRALRRLSADQAALLSD